jgi:tRNA-Thr(GGU) m(6)t(6)A37 methyltransferase TsaA
METFTHVEGANIMTPEQSYAIHPIGHVHAVEQEGRYEVHVFPAYIEALEQLAAFSHVVIVWWAHQHDNPADRKTMTAELPYAPGVRAGVFACRSEYRPNPIGITIMPMLAVDTERGVITLPWIDTFDGTPVLDLKPYLPISDRVRDVRVAGWMQDWPQWMEDAEAFFAAHHTDFGS